MITLRKGTLTIREGRLTADICVEAGATLRNDAEVYTHTTLSDGEIAGSGTLWAHVTSKPIGGMIDDSQVIIYWPKVAALVLPMPFGNLFSIQKQTGHGELT